MTSVAETRTNRLLQHEHAPIWRWRATDRLGAGDVERVRVFEDALRAGRETLGEDPDGAPPARVVRWVTERRARVPSFLRRIPDGADVADTFDAIATASREDVAVRPELFVPDDEPLDRMIVYRTAGTTGHALLVPHDPRATACYLPLIAVALERFGVRAPNGGDEVGAFNVGAQRRTVTYPCTLSAWGDTGFAKINVHAGEWRARRDPHVFFEDLAPRVLTGDPISFSELLRLGIDARPAAMITTAVALSDALRDRLRERFGCPVIDWYSLTETGPIGYSCRDGHGYHVLPHDLYVEVVDERGARVAPGERGEITVTGGRNPYLPLLRYRTGDFGSLDRAACSCGDPAPRLIDLIGRPPVVMRAADGVLVNTVDVARALREHPLVQHELVQRADRSIELAFRPAGGADVDPDELASALRALFGALPIDVRRDDALGDRSTGGKVYPFRSELPLEE